jgi:hypothetical protein
VSERIRGFRVSIVGGHQSVWCKDRAAVIEVLDECTGIFTGEECDVHISVDHCTQAELDAMGDWQGF